MYLVNSIKEQFIMMISLTVLDWTLIVHSIQFISDVLYSVHNRKSTWDFAPFIITNCCKSLIEYFLSIAWHVF